MSGRHFPIILLVMMTHEQFLADVEAFLARTGTSASRFGREAIGDPNFVLDLRSGRVPSLRTAERVMSHIAGADDFSLPAGGGIPCALNDAAPSAAPHTRSRSLPGVRTSAG